MTTKPAFWPTVRRFLNERVGAKPYRLTNALAPGAFLESPLQGAPSDDDGSILIDIDIDDGRIARMAPAAILEGDSRPRVDLQGRMVWPTLVDMHTHLDKGQSISRTKPDGSIVGGATGTAADRAFWSEADIYRRMEFGLRCAYAHGVAAIRTHIDSNHDLTERSWKVFRTLRAEWADRIILQGVALAPLDMFLGADGETLADLAASSEGVLGGVTDGIGDDWGDTTRLEASLDRFFALAAERNLDVDLHVDQTDDINAFALPKVAEAALRADFHGRVVCGHCVNLALQSDDILRTTLELCARAGLSFVTLPTPMMYLMDRTPGRTPRWRGVTAAQEIRAAGLPIAIGGDNCRDAWFAYGDHDMVDTFQQAVRVLQLDHPIGPSGAMTGPVPARIMGHPQVGTIAEGEAADLMLFSARNFSEIMSRPQADRIILRNGRVIQQVPPDYSELDDRSAPDDI